MIEMMLPAKISYDYGELSWVWISICSAIEYLIKLESIVESRGSHMCDIISCVIEQQLGD